MKALGFIGNLLSDILDGDGAGAFGQRIRSSDHGLRDLYEKTYFDFGLTPPRQIKEGQFVPMTISTWGGKTLSFEIHGNILTPITFMLRGWGNPFTTISREIQAPKGRVWAFDITRLHESILSGTAVFPNDESYIQSEEYLKVLRVVGSAHLGSLHSVPEIQLEFGDIWRQYGIPDRIFVACKGVFPISDYHLRMITNLLLHAYNRSDAPPVAADYSMNEIDGTVTMTMRDTSIQPKSPTSAPEPQQPATPAAPADDFPYDFYRGLGLINDDDTVTVPSMLGPVNADMRDPLVKQFLLEYKPEG